MIPFIATITIGGVSWAYSDWLANDTGTFAEIANAIGAAISSLGIGVAVTEHLAAGTISITTSGLHFIRKTVPEATTVIVDRSLPGKIAIYTDATADEYPVSVTVAFGGTINGQSSLDLALPRAAVELVWLAGSGEYAITAML